MNRKLLSVATGMCLFSTLALADENSGFFIGTDAIWMHSEVRSNIEHKNSSNVKIFSGDMSGNMPAFGLRAGYRLNDTHRIYSAYSYSDEFSDLVTISKYQIEGDFTTHKFLLGYDFTPRLFEKIRALLGVYSGYAKTNIDLKAFRSSLGRNFDGFVYGAKAGAVYELTQHNEIELGFKAEQISYNSKNFDKNGLGSNLYNPTQRNYGVYLGYNYKF
ncbi:porin family protein [Campylobacter sp. VicNov18]|uniref:outer membrane beta-barrel protein n=1 Tax=Campylobacter bilis TaxID=2691918 RepID=UPI00130EF972|nr:outer membrane beta-barrel protein [Campylobacter bilis]MPV64060.1 outer membrane beta-barrel protein [Campylobacter hepaticus]MBM0637562.1 outer membrane beta-barrel protein [Campylobacter bilis]MCC8278288.1 porin family protein [Campylobacter bilis]MCC8299792.1 porin family protein [Campylobacter bilis]MCC8301197.1 porin family protein [Campylobacter bilis]